MPDTSYESDACDAMADSDRHAGKPWVELPCHRQITEAVGDWLGHLDSDETYRISGATGTGKSQWLRNFAARSLASGPYRRQRKRWVVARFGRGEPVTSQGLTQQWSRCLERWVERPSRYAQASEARKWLDLAIQAQQAEGYAVVRVIESDRARFYDDPSAQSMTRGVLWLAREPFRGSRQNDHSIVLPVWSHDELALVLSQLYPSIDWPDPIVSEIWSKSSGRARLALKLASAFARRA